MRESASPPRSAPSAPVAGSEGPAAPGGPAPGPVPESHRRVHTSTGDLRGAMNLMARQMALDGWAVDLQGTVVHTGGTPIVALLLALSAAACLTATARPLISGAVLMLVAAAVLADLSGHQSIVRRLLPRRASRTLLVWPGGAPPPPLALPPGPGGAPQTPSAVDGQRGVLVVLPARIGEPGPHPLAARLAVVMAGVVAMSGLMPTDAQDAFVLVAFPALTFLALTSAIACRRRTRVANQRPGTASLVRQLGGALRSTPNKTTRVCLAAVGGLEPWFDPIETLLTCNRPLFAPEHTLVVVWTPGPGPLTAVVADGARGDGVASSVLVGAVKAVGIVETTGTALQPSSPGERARSCGWRAISLRGGGQDPESSLRTLHALVQRVDSQAASGRW